LPGKCCDGIRPTVGRTPHCRLCHRSMGQPKSTSRRVGGCTFPEDPAQTCACVLPMWTAAIDPRVLAVRALNPADGHARLFEGRSAGVRMVQGQRCEHLVIDHGRGTIRLDVIDGTVVAGPVTLRFDLADDDRLDFQLSAMRAFRGPAPVARSHVQLARRLLALQTVDARDAGASLRETADIVLGPGAWPGDGEHRKSLIRRMIVAGASAVRAGPKAILAGR